MDRIKSTVRHPAVIALVSFAAFGFFAAMSSCFLDTKTNLCDASGIRCRPGQTCAANQAACIDVGGCGDGILTEDEVCDDGNVANGDRCNAYCSSDESCGNGFLDEEIDEVCDPAISGTNDCSLDCTFKRCGNRILDTGESCDSGGVDTLGCNAGCTPPRCGDGYWNAMAEFCDPLDGLDNALCDNDCTEPRCGDGHTNLSYKPDLGGLAEACDAGRDTVNCNSSTNGEQRAHCQLPRCPDGYRNPMFTPPGGAAAPEGCDEGGNTANCNGGDSSDGHANCQIAVCGDGYNNPLNIAEGGMGAPEKCDSGDDTAECNGHKNSNGKGNCQLAVCGDGYFNPQNIAEGLNGEAEKCDAGGDSVTCNGNNNASGTGNCQPRACRDGYHNTARDQNGNAVEQCDPMAPDASTVCGTDRHCTQACTCIDD